jgi:hypothetical protein
VVGEDGGVDSRSFREVRYRKALEKRGGNRNSSRVGEWLGIAGSNWAERKTRPVR